MFVILIRGRKKIKIKNKKIKIKITFSLKKHFALQKNILSRKLPVSEI